MPKIFCTLAPSEEVRHVEVSVEGELTAVDASSLCRAVRDHLERGAQSLTINLENVKAADPVGLAALLQSCRLAERLGVRLSVCPGPAAYRALLAAKLVSELTVVPSEDHTALLLAGPPAIDLPAWHVLFVAKNQRIGLRLPAWEDLALFERWAQEPLLDQMVGSDLLYACRHLGAYHPDFTPLVLNDPTALTLLVHPLAPPASPVGYVRLFNIHLVEQFAFLETAVSDLRSLRKGWGIEASRLLLAYALDALGLCRVEAKVYAYNPLSINSLKRNGFTQEGVLRHARSYDGQRWDILVFSILHEEMVEQRKQEVFPYMGFWGQSRDDPP
ncbi:MAG: GNAT family N-acetyltransferase [Candidatus Rokubacteria bacterium]|nr:GNAT family N-acetyltransferase [Candidatus Rokubacteria bacterium]